MGGSNRYLEEIGLEGAWCGPHSGGRSSCLSPEAGHGAWLRRVGSVPFCVFLIFQKPRLPAIWRRRRSFRLGDQLTSLPAGLSSSLFTLDLSLSPSVSCSFSWPLCGPLSFCLSPSLYVSASLCFSISLGLPVSLSVSLPFLLHFSLSFTLLLSCDLPSSARGEPHQPRQEVGVLGGDPYFGLSPGWGSSAPLAGEMGFHVSRLSPMAPDTSCRSLPRRPRQV